MTPEEQEEQEDIHRALCDVLRLDEGYVLTGWIVLHESVGLDGHARAGHFYGPETMTTWRAMGLVEWARQHTLPKSANE